MAWVRTSKWSCQPSRMTKAGTDWTWNGHSALPAKKHGLLFASQAQTQNIVLKQMKTATESLGATWEVKKMKALPQNCSKIDIHWAMPGIPDFVSDLTLKFAVSDAKAGFKIGGVNEIRFAGGHVSSGGSGVNGANDDIEKIPSMAEMLASGLKPTGIGVGAEDTNITTGAEEGV